MKLKPRKPIYAFLILLPLIVLFSFVLFTVRNNTLNQRTELRNEQKFAAIKKTLNVLESEMKEENDRFRTQIENLMELMPILLKPYMENDVYKGPEFFTDAGKLDGFVVQVKNDMVIYPETDSELPDLDSNLVKNEVFLSEISGPSDEQGTDNILISSRKISGDYYYIDMTSRNEMSETVQKTAGMMSTLDEIEKIYDCILIMVGKTASEAGAMADDEQNHEPSGPFEYLYRSDYFSDNTPLDMSGITRSLIEEKPSRLSIGGQDFRCEFQQLTIFDKNADVVILAPLNHEYVNIINSVMLVVILTLIITIPLILWLYWCQEYVRNHELLPEQVEKYHPTRLKELVIIFGLIGASVVFLTALCFQSLSNLNLETIANRNALKILMDRLAQVDSSYSYNEEDAKEWETYFAERIAELISGKTSLQTEESLNKINELAGSDYMMVFDSLGEEIAGSNGVIGLSINDTENLKVFRGILSGSPTLVTDPLTDPLLNKNMQYIGTRIPMRNEDKKKGYGVLLLAFDVEKSWQEADIRFVDFFLRNATLERNLVIVTDQETNQVLFSSDTDLWNQKIPDLIHTKERMGNSDLDSFLIRGKHYYGPYLSDDSFVCYYLTEDTYIRISSFMFSVLAVTGYCVILFIISLFMMKPYSEEAFFEAIKIKSPAGQEDGSETEQNPNSLTDLLRYVGNRIETRKKQYWNEMLPEQKLGIFIRIFLGIIVALMVFVEIRMNLYSDRNTINFVLTGNWKRGMNLLGWSAALIVVIGFAIFSFLKDILQRFFCSVHDPKIETVFRLFFSLVQYIAVIFSIYLILGYLGFNTTMQLTSIGIFSLAISLGSQTLVSDILAGIFIIFEGGFHVGDIIDIDGFSGVVQEIGVRSTKLIGLGNDTMIINNSKINRILNMSQMNDWFTMEFCINYDQPLTEIEDMLNRELPELKNTIPEIISGPYYKGVWSISSGSGGPKYTLSITCECDSNNTRMVQRKLNHALIMLFDKYQYKLA